MQNSTAKSKISEKNRLGFRPVALYDLFTGNDLAIAQLIQRRRLQILVHACIYYGLNNNLVPDATYDKWENELVELQKEHPNIAEKVIYAEAFADWDGSTGAFLPYYDPNIVAKARMLIENNYNL